MRKGAYLSFIGKHCANGYPFSDIPVMAMYHLSAGISENGYPFSDKRTLNCKGIAPSHIIGG